ncbi:hypothetical protein OXYTRIMIC_560 [Oxytricha trifallax]|uniref:Uncharacterized protein n=1 Tax=Oxytricha trifallax TaxID=1172189 RepID=A0A073IAY6_9SPIT|nr:hypothetical protein OXYTRIMIC_560 [Oxytricha trifallax]
MAQHVETILKLPLLAIMDNLQQQVLAPGADNDFLIAAYSWLVLRNPRTKLAHFIKNIEEDNEQAHIDESGVLEVRVNRVEAMFQNTLVEINSQLFSLVFKMFGTIHSFRPHLPNRSRVSSLCSLASGFNADTKVKSI